MDDVGEWVTDVLTTFSFLLSLGRLRNHDDDDGGIEILKKIERFSEQNDNSARASHFPDSTFFVGQKHKTMIFSFFLNLDMVLESSIPEKFAYFCQINRNEIFAMRFETARTHFVIKVFAAVAVVFA